MEKSGKPPGQPGTPKTARGGEDKRRAANAKKERRHPFWRVLGISLLSIAGVLVFAGGAAGGYVVSLLKGLPTVSAATFANMSAPSVVYDRNGKVIARFTKDGDRQPVQSINQVSPYLVKSFIAAEDKTFYQNIGINPLAMGRAFFQDLRGHRIESGASTITQQTVKLAVFPAQQRTMKRKVQEIALAVELNHILTKNEIMTDYMNWVYMGRMGIPVYGVKTASEIMFGKSPLDLNLPESAFLAAIPNNPSYFSPYQFYDHTLQRQHYILNQMLINHMISQSEYNNALKFDIKKVLRQDTVKTTIGYPYVMIDNVQPIVAQDLVNAGLYDNTQQAVAALPTAGYKIYTSIDLSMQDHVNSVLSNDKLFGNSTQGKNLYEAGVTLMDNRTGGILAIGGGRHFSPNYNGDMLDHSDIPRQPGSSIKPLIDYGPAIDLHKLTAGTVLFDVPVTYGNYSPKNDENNWSGLVTARQALIQSINVPAIKVLDMITPEVGTSYLNKMGITVHSTTLDGQPSLTQQDTEQLSTAIGGMVNGLTVQQMTSAYTVFPNQGVWRHPYLISKIADAKGKAVYQFKPQVTQVFSPQTAYIITNILHDVVYNPAGTAYYGVGLQFPGYQISGKTGTTDSLKDGWFVGYTQKYTMGIWMGYDRHQTIALQNYNLKFSLWDDIMRPFLKSSPPTKPFPEPSGIVREDISGKSGELPTKLSIADHDVYSELFIQGTQPTQYDKVHVQVPYTVINGVKYLATTNTPPNEVKVGIFLKPPFPIPANISPPPLDSSQYIPTQPDPRGGTVLTGSVTPTPDVLPPPQNVSVRENGAGVEITWDKVVGATSYQIWRSTTPNGPFVNVAGPVVVNSYTDSNLPSGAQSVYYEVYAISNSGVSPPSSPVEVPLSAVGGTGTGGTQNSTGTQNLIGTENSTGAQNSTGLSPTPSASLPKKHPRKDPASALGLVPMQ
ncbi:transglycosylase domain-containing protein [Alicyclobacillus tolerans]|uniref:transglycosylase domain-containing protein n=1 Tax=Alicyclobacillus tolerans TaxID=90970 RepID=UPI001F344FF4|nr:transglycosylase domain-containing protein [Alicyclobacillus tolerans]MCF8565213.1 transglycosylase domain-containing protein [Alicyclobacillus tolerans]